ncbi:MAG: hypothetical protein J7L55_01445 [Desulfurococcales archaeon]|nr:hypothetical protein [Desulfurococcales archaeon]
MLSVGPAEMPNLVRALSKLKHVLEDELGFKCSSQEHSFICGVEDTLIKVVPVSPKNLLSTSMGGASNVASLRISSTIAKNIVELDDVVVKVLRDENLRYRRVA